MTKQSVKPRKAVDLSRVKPHFIEMYDKPRFKLVFHSDPVEGWHVLEDGRVVCCLTVDKDSVRAIVYTEDPRPHMRELLELPEV